MAEYYIEHYGYVDDGHSLVHYGVRGMRWRQHKYTGNSSADYDYGWRDADPRPGRKEPRPGRKEPWHYNPTNYDKSDGGRALMDLMRRGASVSTRVSNAMRFGNEATRAQAIADKKRRERRPPSANQRRDSMITGVNNIHDKRTQDRNRDRESQIAARQNQIRSEYDTRARVNESISEAERRNNARRFFDRVTRNNSSNVSMIRRMRRKRNG